MYGKGLPETWEYSCKCKHCKEVFDLCVAEEASRQKKIRAIKCPKCKKRVATAN